jgi:hypothetical protein
VNDTFASPPGGGSSSTGGTDGGAGDPVSWLQIEQGWAVVGADDGPVGTVLSVAGDKENDIFDGLAIDPGGSEGPRYVPSEQVGSIFPGRVTLRFAAAAADRLEPFVADRPETVWRPSAPSLGTRLSNWLRGRR